MTTAANPQAREFLTALFADGEGVVNFRAFVAKDKSAPASSLFCRYDAATQVMAFCATEVRHHRDVYCGIASRRDGKSGKLENCVELHALFADFDYKHTPGEAVRQTLATFPLSPSMEVASGGGLHVYWLLREPLDLTTEAPRAKDLLRRLAISLKADLEAAEPARVLRVPGTKNFKYDPPREVTIQALNVDRRYNLSEFDILPEEPITQKESAPHRPPPPLAVTEEMLAVVPADERTDWLNVGIILGREYGCSDAAWSVYQTWSEKWGGTKAADHDAQMRDAFYKRSQHAPVGRALTIATIFKLAKDHGWVPKEGAAIVSVLNQENGVIWIQGKCKILKEEYDPALDRETVSFADPKDLRIWYADVPRIQIGKQRIPAVDFWLQHAACRKYRGLTFVPGATPPGFYNVWRGFAVEPRAGHCQRYLDHLRTVITNNNTEHYTYLLAWMANLVQHPTNRPGTAVVLRGSQGTGKGAMVTLLGRLFGRHFVHLTQARHLLGNFNAHLKEAVLVYVDEGIWAGDKHGEGVLKALITEDTHLVEFKGINALPMKNYMRLIISSNHDWVVPAGIDDRRFFVLDVNDLQKQKTEHFKALFKEMTEQGGDQALLHYLLHYDYSRVNLRQAPKTDALMEQKTYTMSPVEKFWFECLRTGSNDPNRGWCERVEASVLYDWFIIKARKAGVSRRGTETELGIYFKRLGIRKEKRTCDRREIGQDKDGMLCWRDLGAGQTPLFEFPSLPECRKAFDTLTGYKPTWDEGEVSDLSDLSGDTGTRSEGANASLGAATADLSDLSDLSIKERKKKKRV